MNCRKTQYLLVDYMEGLLPERKIKGVQRHLASCESCRKQHERMQQLHRSLQSLSIPEPDATDWERFQRRLQERLTHPGTAESGTRALKPALKLLIPAVATVSIIIVLFLFSGKLPWGAQDRVSDSGKGAGQEVSQPAAQPNGSATAEFVVALANLPGEELDQLEDETTFLMEDEAGMGLPGAVVSKMFSDEGIFEEVEGMTLDEYDELFEGLGSI